MRSLTLLLAGGTKYAIILVVVLLISGGITALILAERQRRAKARARAEERRKLREESLRKARNGQVNAFEAMNRGPAAVQTPESVLQMSQSQWIKRVESRRTNLETLISAEQEEKRLQMAEAQMSGAMNGYGQAPGVSAPAVTAPYVAPEPVYAPTASADYENRTMPATSVPVAPTLVPETAPAVEPSMPAIEPAVSAVEPAMPAVEPVAPADPESSAFFRSMASRMEAAEKAEKQAVPIVPVKEEVKPAVAAAAEIAPVMTIPVEEDINFSPRFRTEEEKPTQESVFMPFRDKYEVKANDFENRMAAPGSAPEAAGPQNPVTETPAPAVSMPQYGAPQPETSFAGYAPAPETLEPAPMEQAVAGPVYTAPAAPMYTAPAQAAPGLQAPAAPVYQAPAPAAPVYQAPAPAAPVYQNPTFGIDFNMTDEELGIAEEEAEDMTAVMPAAPDTYYGAEEAYSEGDDEARARRMADKAQFAAALAGEIDIDELQRQRAAQNGRFPSAEAEDLLDDEDYDDEEEEEAEVSRGGRIALWIVSIFLFLVCIGAGIYLFLGSGIMKKSAAPEQSSAESSYETSRVVEAAPVVSEPMEEISEVVPEPEPEPEPEPVFTTFVEEPHYVASTDPANFDMEWEISKDGELVETYTREESISFGDGADYARVDGVLTFRGNNYRTDAAFGTTGMTKIEFGGAEWTRMNGGLDDSSGDMWSGIGWTGQPLIVRWDEDVRKAMTSMYEEKREKDGLVEVIYATMDGYIYFFDLEDGSKTRDSLWVGMTFKGAGALDPRGLPLMYVGSGVYNYYSEAPRAYIINLVDNSIVTSFGQYDSFAHRDWPAFDSSPIVNAETDTLIWPGENGILYTVKLNTSFNAATGEFTCEPDEPVRMRYTCPLSYERYYGVECSMTAFDHYGYYSDNAGFFFCVDLNTMEVIWLQDTNDDSNSTPIFEFDEKTGRGYLYTAPSLHWTKDYSDSGTVPIYKLDAITGEIIWKVDYKCLTITDISGGVQSSPAIGRPGTNLEGMIFYTIARIYREENPYDYYSGLMVALDTETGEEIWRWEMADYTWSSPVGVYTDDGKGYMIVFDSEGDGFLMDGLTGERMDSTSVGWLVEASPAVFEDRLVVGTRGSEIYCISLK